MNFDHWASAALGSIIIFIAVLTKEAIRKIREDVDKFKERLQKVELTTVTEDKVRQIISEAVAPLTISNHNIEEIVRKIELEVAALPKRKYDQ